MNQLVKSVLQISSQTIWLKKTMNEENLKFISESEKKLRFLQLYKLFGRLKGSAFGVFKEQNLARNTEKNAYIYTTTIFVWCGKLTNLSCASFWIRKEFQNFGKLGKL